MREVHAEVEYVRSDGSKVHSDICPANCSAEGITDVDYRKRLHECLDEWLNNSKGSCGFYIKDAAYKFDFQE
jgi:hypothetical protein